MTPLGLVFVILLSSMMLTGMSVIFDKEQGASFRVSISPATKIKWLFGKVLGQLLFALGQVIIIILVGAIFFGVSVQGNIIELVLALSVVSLSFITMGLFITNFTKTQSTTILASLLMIVPMIFLSGIIFPYEFMPASVSFFGKLLPLTQGIELVSTVLVRGLPLVSMSLGFFYLLVLSGIFFATAAINPDYLK